MPSKVMRDSKQATTYTASLISQAFRVNDSTTLERIYAANYPKAERYLADNKGNAEQAKDIFQEAFLAVWKNIRLEKFNPQSEDEVAAYLYRIVKNKWIDHLRSVYNRDTVLTEEFSADRKEDDETDQVTDKEIEKVSLKFTEIGDNCKDLLTRFYYKKQSLREISTALGWTEATARNNKYRCIQKLRDLMIKKDE